MNIPKGNDGIEINGLCHDCGCEVSIRIAKVDDEIGYDGGEIYETKQGLKVKCPACFEKKPELEMKKITECEVYSRVVGYLRPVAQWNNGKQAEFKNRKNYIPKTIDNKGLVQIHPEMPTDTGVLKL